MLNFIHSTLLSRSSASACEISSGSGNVDRVAVIRGVGRLFTTPLALGRFDLANKLSSHVTRLSLSACRSTPANTRGEREREERTLLLCTARVFARPSKPPLLSAAGKKHSFHQVVASSLRTCPRVFCNSRKL